MIQIVTSDNPVAVAEGRAWQVNLDGQRVYGPDTLPAVIEAASILRRMFN